MSDDFVRQNSADQDKKLDAEKLQVGGLDVYRLRTTSGPMSVKLDQVDANTLYIGEALPGTAGSEAAWRIRKFLTAGSVSSMLYANGDSAFSNIWDNRAGLTYS
jgi:hypothetical protein